MTAERPKALVMGLGKSGYASVRHLLAQGYEVEVTDTRPKPPMLDQLNVNHPGVPFLPGHVSTGHLEEFDLVVSSPGLSVRTGAVADYIANGGSVVGDVEIFARAAKAPIIAITGSNGKSTVTMLVGHVLASAMRVAVGGNIGTPVLDLLEQPVPDVYVLELSSFQLETTYSLDARAAVVLNVSEDHMDRYDDLRDYADSKQRIFNGHGVMVLNRDDPLVQAMASQDRNSLFFTINEPSADNDYGLLDVDGETWLMKGSRRLLPASEVPLAGRHNLANVLAALALIDDFELSFEIVRKAISTFTGLPHRSQLVAEIDGVQWINDSKATNVGATAAALAGMDRPVVLLAGGEGKDADFRPLAEAIQGSAHTVILFGRDAVLIGEAIAGAANIVFADGLEQAVQVAAQSAKPGDVVMLSPACASFDMFDNFEHRGQVFIDLVNKHARARSGARS